ncbi:prepilin peptidase [Moorella naiadis]|uniref:prepilin peptidase n=1 Tax=Moorella naiadis (nom. illeg.) TaxID=3093670 RepID=UPI003D9C8D31
MYGATFASYACMLAYRLPEGKSTWGRSRCESCGRTLTWLEVLPIFGYFIAGGRCRACGYKIPLIYLLVEMLFGILSVWLLVNRPFWWYLRDIIILTLILAAGLSDLKQGKVPRKLSFALAVVGVFWWFLAGQWLVPVWGFWVSLPVVIMIILESWQLGEGDVLFLIVLTIALGLSLSIKVLAIAIILAGIFAFALRMRNCYLQSFPLATFLLAGAILSLFF